MASTIGKLINLLRTDNQITIIELSTRSGISEQKLTEIESGSVTPSLGMLIRITRSLGSRLGTLLDGRESFGAVVTRSRGGVESRAYQGADAEAQDHMNFFSLAQGKTDRHMEPLIVEIRTSDSAVENKSEHEGEEFIYVLEGSIKAHYGEETHLLERGDSIYYDSIVPHSLQNMADQPSKILAVIYTPY